MWVLVIVPMLFSAMILLSGSTDALLRDMPQEHMRYRTEAARVIFFKQAADIYIAQNPTASGQVTWATIRTAAGMPSGIASISFDSSWKIYGNGDGTYTLCATVSDGAAGYVAESIGFKKDVSINKDSSTGRFVFSPTAGSIATEAAKCS